MWPFVAQHAAEVQKRQVYGEECCAYEFASLVLVKVKEPKDVLEPRFRLALFLGYAPAVTHGYYVLHKDGRVEMTSNLQEKPVMDISEEP